MGFSLSPHLPYLPVELHHAGLVAMLGVSPLLISLLADTLRYGYYIAPGLGRVQVFSAEPISFFVPSFTHPLLGAWANALTNANTSYAFVGYAALILAVLGFIFHRAARRALLVGERAFLRADLAGTDADRRRAKHEYSDAVCARARDPVCERESLSSAFQRDADARARAAHRVGRGAVVANAAHAFSPLIALLAFEQLALPIPLTDLRAPKIFETIRDRAGRFHRAGFAARLARQRRDSRQD